MLNLIFTSPILPIIETTNNDKNHEPNEKITTVTRLIDEESSPNLLLTRSNSTKKDNQNQNNNNSLMKKDEIANSNSNKYDYWNKVITELNQTNFIPGLDSHKSLPNELNWLVVAHLCGCGNIMTVSVYATSWVATTVLRGDPNASFYSLESKIFELGVSWGALGMFFSASVFMIASIVIKKYYSVMNKSTCKFIYILSQLAASISLLSCFYIDSFRDIFIILPFCGFAFATFHSMPEKIADIIEEKYEDQPRGAYKDMLSLSLFLSQVVMFLIVPGVFLLYPERDDNLWSMLSAGVTGLSACLFITVV